MIAKYIAGLLGVGYIRGGGTIAAGIAAVLWYFFMPGHLLIQAAAVIIITGIGIWSSGRVERVWGHDSHRVVIDEVAGMMLTLLYVPHQVSVFIAGFIIFRFFDIVKPLGIRKAEQLKGGLGVMGDDLLAGAYSCILLNILVAAGTL